jgi:hypothetical protein
MKTLEENNRMIVEFMGHEEEQTESGEFVYAIEFQNPEKLNDIQVEFFCAHEFKYHISWDWLMPVVEKIESLEYSVEKNLQRIDGDFQCLITKGNDILFQEFAVKSIEAMHYVVVEFINFYNEQK